MFLASHHFLNSVSDLYSFQSMISKSEHTEKPLHWDDSVRQGNQDDGTFY